MSFKKKVFKGERKVLEADLFQSSMDGKQYAKSDWVPLAMSIAAKDDLKYEQSYREFLGSYVQAMDILCNAATKRSHPFPKFPNIPAPCPLLDSSLTLPCLFSGRHVMELSLKWMCYRLNGAWPVKTHGLWDLWEKFQSLYPENDRTKCDSKIMKTLESFVIVVNKFDPSGFCFRYAIKNDGKTFCLKEWKFVDIERFRRLVHDFVEQLECLEYPDKDENQDVVNRRVTLEGS